MMLPVRDRFLDAIILLAEKDRREYVELLGQDRRRR